MNLFIAILFNIITVILITSLKNILEALENPFDECGLDDIHITSEFTELKNYIEYLDVDSDEFLKYDEYKLFENTIKEININNN